MNYNDIKLPPLPPLHIAPSVEPVDYPEVAQALIDYARAAIKADRQRRNKALQAENAQLRAAIRRLCNIYVVDDYYMGKLREEMLERAVKQAIDDAKDADYKG